MRTHKWFTSFLGKMGRILKPNGRLSRLEGDALRFGYPSPGQEDGLQNLVRFSHTQEIEVEEVEQEVFVREWSKTQVDLVAGEASHGDATGTHGVDRRLPNFERRHPKNDRRAGNGHDRRANGTAGSHRSSHT
jgi:hypothetical protein